MQFQRSVSWAVLAIDSSQVRRPREVAVVSHVWGSFCAVDKRFLWQLLLGHLSFVRS